MYHKSDKIQCIGDKKQNKIVICLERTYSVEKSS